MSPAQTASPRARTVPSAAASQAPAPVCVGLAATTGAVDARPPGRARLPFRGTTRPRSVTIQAGSGRSAGRCVVGGRVAACGGSVGGRGAGGIVMTGPTVVGGTVVVGTVVGGTVVGGTVVVVGAAGISTGATAAAPAPRAFSARTSMTWSAAASRPDSVAVVPSTTT